MANHRSGGPGFVNGDDRLLSLDEATAMAVNSLPVSGFAISNAPSSWDSPTDTSIPRSTTMSPEKSTAPTEEVLAKRKRGRPPKNKNILPSVEGPPVEPPMKRKRGRPPKPKDSAISFVSQNGAPLEGLSLSDSETLEGTDDEFKFRPSGGARANRAGRSQLDHDPLEGLPIRQWDQVETTVGPPMQAQQYANKNAWPELPMPQDSHLLPEVSQQLLRAARAGKIRRPPTPPNDEEKDPEEDEEAHEIARSFSVKKWSQVPRHLEKPEVTHLAKRRKGLPPVYSSWSGALGPIAHTAAMRKTKVKRVDSEGNTNVYEVLVPEGQTVEGEIVEDEAEVQPVPTLAPGTYVEGVGIVNADGVVVAGEVAQATPPRRRPPPPKRKPKKGPGRGRKKVVFNEGTDGTPTITINGESQDGASVATPLIKAEGAESNAATPAPGDTPMPDAHEGEDDESGSDDDREEGELSESGEEENTPAKSAAPPAPAAPGPSASDALSSKSALEVPPDVKSRDPSSSPEISLAAAQAISHSRSNSLTQPTLDSPTPANAGTPKSPGQSADDEPVKDDLAKEEPANEEPANDEPANDEPATDQPMNEEPAIDQPMNEEPAKNEPASEELVKGDEEARKSEGEVDLFSSLEKQLGKAPAE